MVELLLGMGEILSSILNTAKVTDQTTGRQCCQGLSASSSRSPITEDLRVLGRDLLCFLWSQQPCDLGPVEDTTIGLLMAILQSQAQIH